MVWGVAQVLRAGSLLAAEPAPRPSRVTGKRFVSKFVTVRVPWRSVKMPKHGPQVCSLPRSYLAQS
jgi:hypothetical protein